MKPSGLELLLHLAGQLPDELLELARDRFAAGDLPEVGRLIRFGHAAYGCTAPPECYDIACALFAAAGAPEKDVATLVFPRAPVPPYEFWPVPDGKISRPLDLTVDADSLELYADELDHAVVAHCGRVPGLRGVWRAWRSPLGNASWPPQTRMFIAEVDIVADPSAVRGLLRDVAGPSAMVEVLQTGARVPTYHQRARTASALLWVARARPQQTMAPEVELLDQSELGCADHVRAQLRQFLQSGTDVPALPSWRTDGEWIWPADYIGYLDQHGIVPHGPLLEHASKRDFTVGEVDSIAGYQAGAALHRSR